ncbi:MAG: recombinase family protein, partial [Ktedonobacteraceae bacterium]|nr:recombinase family protein [Ktedonobacteraceae bacterium]
MTVSELITPAHLQKKAMIYVRQSTLTQVLFNQESLRLQYALEQRAQSLGWRAEDIEVIDADLGLTGASAQHRSGFQELVTKVTLGQAGIILSSDVTRLSRNCSDWYPLLDVCGYRDCLIADQEGVYDPGSTNGRLLLGLKGQLSELELHTIRARMTAGLLNKARRGELALTLPVGLMRDAAGRVHQDPHQEVHDRLQLIFATFLQKRGAEQGAGVSQPPRPLAAAARSLRRPGLEAPHSGSHPANSQKPSLRRGLCLWPHAYRPHRSGLPSCETGPAPT